MSYQQGLGADYAQHIVPDYEDEEFGNSYLSQGETAQTQNLYTSQTFSDHALFGLKGPNNGGGVAFQTDSDKVTSISIFTNSTGNDVLTGSLRTNITDASTELISKEITVTASGWQTFTFDQPITVKKEKLIISLYNLIMVLLCSERLMGNLRIMLLWVIIMMFRF